MKITHSNKVNGRTFRIYFGRSLYYSANSNVTVRRQFCLIVRINNKGTQAPHVFPRWNKRTSSLTSKYVSFFFQAR